MAYNNILETIGNTPLVKLNRVTNANAEIFVKLESFNPGSSVKDRIALAMIEDAEKKGILKPNSAIIEPTSGNTGIGLAIVSAAKGYRLILTMPESMSVERRKILSALGAELVLTPASYGMKGAIAKAEYLAGIIPDSFMPQQFKNLSNPQIHRITTATEIWNDTNGEIDFFVSGIGTGGTITGVGEILKSRNPKINIVAVEPEGSPVLSGGQPGPHKIQGIGAGFIPDILNTKVFDQIIKINEQEAFSAARLVARKEGILVGISSGAALGAALKIAENYSGKKKIKIITILPDTGERYLSTPLFEYNESFDRVESLTL